jgi:DNA-binding NarL/FixJ family response regulator
MLLQSCPGLSVLPAERIAAANVVVLVADRIRSEEMETLRHVAAVASARCVLITDDLPATCVLTAVELGVVGVLSRTVLSADRLVRVVIGAHRGQGGLPPDLQGALLAEVERVRREILAPKGLTTSGLTGREVDVLRLMAEGWESAEIAEKLWYSERTVKAVLHGVLSRLKLRNRAHAVAYALRAGLI